MRDAILLSGLIDLFQGLGITIRGEDLLLGQLCCDNCGVMRFSVRLRPSVRVQVDVGPRGEIILHKHSHGFVQMQARSNADNFQGRMDVEIGR